ncbi:ATP-binding protein [Nocardia beijingensis]|uniref:ATP-binding protein n=1 Tax=Nocardia beijingensis TaxID=95162 RepID=UPI00332D7775
METKLVQAGSDTILDLAERTSAVDIVAELIWNAIDAEASQIDVTINLTDLGAPDTIVVVDNGHGMTYEDVSDYFFKHGESWKKKQRFSPNIKRPLHGWRGLGRLLVYGIADRAEWRTVAKTSDGNFETLISGRITSPNSLAQDGPFRTEYPPGTTVTLNARQTAKAKRLIADYVPRSLIARLASSLLAMKDVKVSYCGTELNPEPYILRNEEVSLNLSGVPLHGRSEPILRIVEWSADMRSKALFLCDQSGHVVTDLEIKRPPLTPIHWSAYLQWEGFSDQQLMGQADLFEPRIRHGEIIAAADRAIQQYLNDRLHEHKGDVLAKWKAEGVYPYQGLPAGPAEEVEREIFDIVAVVASPGIGRDTKQKRLSLRLLQEATRAEPSKTRKILDAVLDLSDEEQQVLSELLERTKLASIIRSAQTVADRADFLSGLSGLLFSDVTRRIFREVDQLHPLLVQEPWVFGDEWSMALSESGLTRVVQSVISRQAPDVEYAATPVLLPDGRRGRVDMMFYRYLPESDKNRNLVVELKRPMKLGMKEYSQVAEYATAITEHPEVASDRNSWDFWLVGTEVDRSLDNLRDEFGLVNTTSNYRLWVRTWADLIDQANRRNEAFRKALDLVSTDESSRAYLQNKHAEFIPPSESSDPSS